MALTKLTLVHMNTNIDVPKIYPFLVAGSLFMVLLFQRLKLWLQQQAALLVFFFIIIGGMLISSIIC